MRLSGILIGLISGTAAMFNPFKLAEEKDDVLTIRSFGHPYPMQEKLTPRQYSNTSCTNSTNGTESMYKRSHVKTAKIEY